MSPEIVLLVASTAAGLAAILMLASPKSAASERRPIADRGAARRAAVGVIAGTIVLALSGWFVPAVITAIVAGS